MENVLSRIAESRAQVFVMDISRAVTVDTAVADQFIRITKATQLMGCESIISGISPSVAQTLVELGTNVGVRNFAEHSCQIGQFVGRHRADSLTAGAARERA
jgi:anti-anti-sigma regulatory factor